ncbi:hypothetical protein GQX74_008755 [Glossina fuscipes]|nr:hypothetical protein GQX74_008755 [Glossina fuscipes]
MCPRKKIPPIENKSILWCILNDAVTEGGCLRNKTSTGSLEDKHIICSAQAGCEQHSLSEQSVMPSENKDIGLYIDIYSINNKHHTYAAILNDNSNRKHYIMCSVATHN